MFLSQHLLFKRCYNSRQTRSGPFDFWEWDGMGWGLFLKNICPASIQCVLVPNQNSCTQPLANKKWMHVQWAKKGMLHREKYHGFTCPMNKNFLCMKGLNYIMCLYQITHTNLVPRVSLLPAPWSERGPAKETLGTRLNPVPTLTIKWSTPFA